MRRGATSYLSFLVLLSLACLTLALVQAAPAYASDSRQFSDQLSSDPAFEVVPVQAGGESGTGPPPATVESGDDDDYWDGVEDDDSIKVIVPQYDVMMELLGDWWQSGWWILL